MNATITLGTACAFSATLCPAEFTVQLAADGEHTIEADHDDAAISDTTTLPTIEIED